MVREEEEEEGGRRRAILMCLSSRKRHPGGKRGKFRERESERNSLFSTANTEEKSRCPPGSCPLAEHCESDFVLLLRRFSLVHSEYRNRKR